MITNQKSFSHMEPCPNCGSSDNVGVWSDGQKYCFSDCGYYVEASGVPSFGHGTSEKSSLKLPDDALMILPEVVHDWLNQFGITYKEAVANDFRWSASKESLIMPVRDPENVTSFLFWDARYFGHNPHVPKYISKGSKAAFVDCKLTFPADNMVVLVEDKISQIKVGRWANCICLHGSSIGQQITNYLVDRFENIVIWLDSDKSSYATNKAQELRIAFEEVKPILTFFDPKKYTDAEIKNKLFNEK